MNQERAIMNKIMSAGNPLSGWKVNVHCGIGAGYRKSFVVDDASDEGKYVCAVLNSSLARWFALHAPPVACSKKLSMEDMPIPKIYDEAQREIIALVDEILSDKAADPLADTSEMEEEIDWMVYDLYCLTNTEVTAITDALWDGQTSEAEEDAALALAIEDGLTSEPVDIEEVRIILRERHEVRN